MVQIVQDNTSQNAGGALLPHCLLYLTLHLRRYVGGACGKLCCSPFSILLNVLDKQLHLGYFADLRLYDLVCEFANPWIAVPAFRALLMAIEWCGIIDCIDLTSISALIPIREQQDHTKQRSQNGNCDFSSCSFVHRPHEAQHHDSHGASHDQ